MDHELDTWVTEVMAKQQYQNGLSNSLSISRWIMNLAFGSKK